MTSLNSFRAGFTNVICRRSYDSFFFVFPVTGFELWASVLTTGLVCSLYTTMVRFVEFIFLQVDLQVLASNYQINLTRRNCQDLNKEHVSVFLRVSSGALRVV